VLAPVAFGNPEGHFVGRFALYRRQINAPRTRDVVPLAGRCQIVSAVYSRAPTAVSHHASGTRAEPDQSTAAQDDGGQHEFGDRCGSSDRAASQQTGEAGEQVQERRRPGGWLGHASSRRTLIVSAGVVPATAGRPLGTPPAHRQTPSVTSLPVGKAPSARLDQDAGQANPRRWLREGDLPRQRRWRLGGPPGGRARPAPRDRRCGRRHVIHA
jgi:hypothetical protein